MDNNNAQDVDRTTTLDLYGKWEDQFMSELTGSPTEFVNNEADKKHIALLYDDQENAIDLELRFIRNGLKKNENCIYATEEDAGFIILKMLNRGIPQEYLKKLLHVYQMPNPFDDPSGPLAGCENNKKMLFTDSKSPFRIVARLVSDVANIDGIKLEMMMEHETHKKFAEFDGTLMCPYDISKIEKSRRKEWLSQIRENHHGVIYLLKRDTCLGSHWNRNLIFALKSGENV